MKLKYILLCNPSDYDFMKTINLADRDTDIELMKSDLADRGKAYLMGLHNADTLPIPCLTKRMEKIKEIINE